jgi:hypothetical protein
VFRPKKEKGPITGRKMILPKEASEETQKNVFVN